jgi:hypothetical protein
VSVLLVTGSRAHPNPAWVKQQLRALVAAEQPSLIVHGACSGVDTVADDVAAKFGIPVKPMAADWARGKRAGPERNAAMVRFACSQGSVVCAAFPHPDLTLRHGTTDCTQRAASADADVRWIEYSPKETPSMMQFPRQQPAAQTAAPSRNKYAGIAAAKPQTPIIPEGMYRVRVAEFAESPPTPGKDTWQTVTFEIVATAIGDAQPGESYAMLNAVTGKAGLSGQSRMKAFAMAAAGYDDEQQFNASAFEHESQLIGRLVDVKVTRGNPTKDGTDYYREFAWGVVPEDEQS